MDDNSVASDIEKRARDKLTELIFERDFLHSLMKNHSLSSIYAQMERVDEQIRIVKDILGMYPY